MYSECEFKHLYFPFCTEFYQIGDWKYNSSFWEVFAEFSIRKVPIFGPTLASENPCGDISMQMKRMTTAFSQRPLCAPAEVETLMCGYGDYMATIRQSHCALLERRYHGVCCGHARSARRRSAFHAIPQRPLAMLLRCCGYACDRTARTSAICINLGNRGIAVKTLFWSDRGLSPSWDPFMITH